MYVGNSFYGIEAAAQGYFNKTAEKLTLPEAAMLVGATNNPYKYSYFTSKLNIFYINFCYLSILLIICV